MLKKITILTAVLVCLISGSALASKVSDIELFYDKGFTTAKIKVDGTVRFSHQTEVEKNGKPYRVIVDMLSATHNLSAKKFLSLPECPVKAIRTSQYSVNPEAIVRVVFDMDMERVYQIDTEGQYVYIRFSDKDTKPFTAWSSSSVMKNKPAQPEPKQEPIKVASKPAPAQKSASELNKEINNDRMASLSDGSTQKAEPKKVSKPVVASKDENHEYSGPKVSSSLTNQSQPKQAAKPAPVKKEESKPVVAQAQPKASTPASKPAAKPTPVKKEESKPVVAQAQPKASTPASKPTAKPAPVKKEESKPVVAQAQPKAEEKAKSTARFRRSTKDSKIQGTMVAEFPKRLVIKYKSKGHRDPFETLINESKQYNNPVDQRIPNVEGLKLVGVIETGDKNNRALFEDTDGYGYILKTGDKVRNGYVLRVDNDKVYFQIFEYGWSRTVSLRLES